MALRVNAAPPGPPLDDVPNVTLMAAAVAEQAGFVAHASRNDADDICRNARQACSTPTQSSPRTRVRCRHPAKGNRILSPKTSNGDKIQPRQNEDSQTELRSRASSAVPWRPSPGVPKASRQTSHVTRTRRYEPPARQSRPRWVRGMLRGLSPCWLRLRSDRQESTQWPQ